MKEKIVGKLEDLPLEDLKECIVSGGEMEFVASNNPRGVVVKKLKNGKTKISVEVTQDMLNNAVENMARLEEMRQKMQKKIKEKKHNKEQIYLN